MKRLGCTVIILYLGLVSGAVSQTNEISKEEYLNPWRTALQRARSLTRRVTQTVTNYDKDMPDIDEWQYEYVMPDRVHYTNIRTFNGKVRRIEQIDIGKIKYCKKDNGVWKLVDSYCIGGSASGGPSGVVSDVYHLERRKIDGKDIKVFRNYITYTNIFSPTKETEGLSFEESIFWLTTDGLIVREEAKRGLVNSEKVKQTRVSVYEYDPAIKIEAPIK